MSIIRTKNLTKYYHKSRGIIDLNLSVKEGDIFGFIGPNGAGKSTTIRTLLGLISPTSGSAKVFGKDCTKNKAEILANVGYISSESMFWGDMRVDEVIKFSAKLRKKDCSAQAKMLCERFSLDTKKKIEELSLGNRKKVGIVCALQHNPCLYILDEATSGLDPLMQKEFFDIIHERNKEGATVFLSSHILSEIGRHCNNAAIVNEGRIVVSDSVESLVKTSARRVHLYGVSKAPNIKGIVDEIKSGASVTFLYRGDMKDLIESLVGLPITDMTVSEPDLEEIFMHFYGGT